MGESHFSTPYKLWQEMVGIRRREGENFAMRHGRETEPIAREAYNAKFGEAFYPHCWESDGLLCPIHLTELCECVTRVPLTWMRASLDGLSFDQTEILEVKCPIYATWHLAALEGEVPGHYYGQVQHQLAVTGAKVCNFWSFFEGEGIRLRVEPDYDYIKRLVVREWRFWNRVQNKEWPKADKGTLDLSHDPNWIANAEAYCKAKREIQKLEHLVKQASANLAEMATSEKTIGCGIEVARFPRKGAVQYGFIENVKRMSKAELEKYRGPTTEVTRISMKGEVKDEL